MGNIHIRGDRVKQLREAIHLEQYDAAYRAGISQGHMSRIESGGVASVGSEILIRLVKLLNTNVEYLIGLSNDPTPRAKTGYEDLSDAEAKLVFLYQQLPPALRDVLLVVAEQLMQAIPHIGVESGGSIPTKGDNR